MAGISPKPEQNGWLHSPSLSRSVSYTHNGKVIQQLSDKGLWRATCDLRQTEWGAVLTREVSSPPSVRAQHTSTQPVSCDLWISFQQTGLKKQTLLHTVRFEPQHQLGCMYLYLRHWNTALGKISAACRKPGLGLLSITTWAWMGHPPPPAAHSTSHVHKACNWSLHFKIIASNASKTLKSWLKLTKCLLSFVLSFSDLFLNYSAFLLLFIFGNGTTLNESKLLFVSTLHSYIKIISLRCLKRCYFPRYWICSTIYLGAKISRYLSPSAILGFPATRRIKKKKLCTL